MRTRRGLCYPRIVARMCTDEGVVGRLCSDIGVTKRKKDMDNESIVSRKMRKKSPEITAGDNYFFDSLPDDLVLTILGKLSSSATCPSDFINVLITYVTITSL